MLAPAQIAQPISTASAELSESKAPWFFLWVQQLLKYGDPFLWGVLTPFLIVIVLGLLPYVLPNAKCEALGRWFPRGNRVAQVFAVLIVVAIIVFTILGALKL
jgi:quinol-cytochrome oxidoreductase complex cytochrome b subunit